MNERRDDPNPLANSVRAALDRRAALTGEPDSEARDKEAHMGAIKEKAKVEAVKGLMAALIYLLQETDPDLDADYNPHAAPRARGFEAIAAARAAGIGGGNG